MGKEIKVFEVKNATLTHNCLKGEPSVMGVLDQGADVIFPGFFSKALPDFRANGFVPYAHRWDDLPVAMPTMIEERGAALYSEAVFHSHQAAQDARTVCAERLEHGLSMGLSVGFYIGDDGYKYFKTGQELLDHAKSLGLDMALFDQKTIKSYKKMCRGLLPGGCQKLFEYSPTPAPMNTSALMSEAKQLQHKEWKQAYADANVPDLSGGPHSDTNFKSEYLGDIERSATCSALNTLNYALQRALWNALYNFQDETVADMLDRLAPAFDEFRDLALAMIRAFLGEMDPEELRESAYDYYYYYAAPATEQAELTFVQRAARLETDTADFVKLASRRQEVRHKAGRKISQETRAKIEAIHAHLSEGCMQLAGLVGGDEAETDAAAPVEDAEALARAGAIATLSLEYELLELTGE